MEIKKGAVTPFGYFGGKIRMSGIIADMLDYSVSTYIEPFGGAGAVILNKPRNSVEIYSDSSLGLSCFMYLMSKEDTAQELIRRIYLTEYSKEEYQKALEYRNSFDDSVEKQLARDFNIILRQLFVKYNVLAEGHEYAEYKSVMKNYKQIIKKIFPMLTKEDAELLSDSADNYKALMDDDVKVIMPDVWGGEARGGYLENYELAVATYVTYSQSRDGQGNYWSSVKFTSPEAYIKQIDRLYDVAERMCGVQVYGAVDALMFIHQYIDNEDVIFYMDPPYLNESLENLGKPYKHIFGEKEQRALIDLICNAGAKILISNYNNEIYNEKLTPDRGWKKCEHETTASSARSGDRARTEVLWYNY